MKYSGEAKLSRYICFLSNDIIVDSFTWDFFLYRPLELSIYIIIILELSIYIISGTQIIFTD